MHLKLKCCDTIVAVIREMYTGRHSNVLSPLNLQLHDAIIKYASDNTYLKIIHRVVPAYCVRYNTNC